MRLGLRYWPADLLSPNALSRFLFLLLLPIQAIAAEEAATGLSSGTYIQATLALLLIVGLLFGTAWLARKVSGGKLFGQRSLRVVGGAAHGPRERIVLLEVEDTWLVVGIVPGQIRTLHQLPKGSDTGSALSSEPSSDTPFASWLQRVKDRGAQDAAT